ncbi:reverse transcriptase domain-containing protein [Tanacetum coccineum]
MVERDEEKIAFFTREEVFCHKRLPFDLKNATATYQKLVDKVYNDKLRCNLEVHVDDMVIKSNSEEDMLVDIKETFEKLRAINMKLNPSKCSLGIEEGPFLRQLITKQGIKANPSKVKAISNLQPPKTIKEKLAALSRFFSKGADKTLPLLKTLNVTIRIFRIRFVWMLLILKVDEVDRLEGFVV